MRSPRDVDYLYNHDWQLLQSETPAGGPTAVDQYVWSVTYVDAPVGKWHDHNGDGDYLDYSDDGQGDSNSKGAVYEQHIEWSENISFAAPGT